MSRLFWAILYLCVAGALTFLVPYAPTFEVFLTGMLINAVFLCAAFYEAARKDRKEVQ